jgi:hypothetical protein
VCLPHGFGHQREGIRLHQAEHIQGASYNDLSSRHALDALSGNAALNGVIVRVETTS